MSPSRDASQPESNFATYAWKVFAGALVGAFAFRHARKTYQNRPRTITVELTEGDTLGYLVTKYVGDYTDLNLDTIKKLNKGALFDVDFLQPGDKLIIPDNRRQQELATAEADWWRRRARSGLLKQSTGPVSADTPDEEPEEKKKGKSNISWGFGKRKETAPEEPKNKIKLIQDEW